MGISQSFVENELNDVINKGGSKSPNKSNTHSMVSSILFTQAAEDKPNVWAGLVSLISVSLPCSTHDTLYPKAFSA